MFQDITTLLLDHKTFKDTVDIFVDRYRNMGISVVAGTTPTIPLSPLLALYFFYLYLHTCKVFCVYIRVEEFNP